ncbi:hypothetical protein ACH5AO_36585 [Streptomyces sp. NPDC018964]|uniref:hypothetical protein n=1 Tax=unclassified Streptomyces TaxID=2593676 RepID=UPI00379A8E7E
MSMVQPDVSGLLTAKRVLPSGPISPSNQGSFGSPPMTCSFRVPTATSLTMNLSRLTASDKGSSPSPRYCAPMAVQPLSLERLALLPNPG